MPISQTSDPSSGRPSDRDFSIAKIFRVLSNTYRFRIFFILIKHEKITGREIAQILGISKATAVKHLDQMIRGHVLSKNKSDKDVYYSINQTNCHVATVKSAFGTLVRA